MGELARTSPVLTQENKLLVRRYYEEVVNTGKASVAAAGR